MEKRKFTNPPATKIIRGKNGRNGVGVPIGGTTGQVLAKVNNTNYNTHWVTISGGDGAVTWDDVQDKPTTFTPSSHTHAISNITNLQPSLDGKQNTLVSGTSIKTINGNSLLGSGDIQISGEGLSDAPSDNESYARRNAEWIQIPRFLTYIKTSNETRSNSTAYTVDANLVSETLMTNAVYRFEMMLLMSGDTANDLRFRVERVGLSDASFTYTGDLDNPVATTFTFNSNINNNLAGAAVRMGNYIGVLITGTDPGTIRLAWGQQVTGDPAIATTMHTGSMLMLRRVA